MPEFLFLLMMAMAYFAPTSLALALENRNVLSIFLLNLFLGWTGIGWVAALVWAAVKPQVPAKG